jgi:hypothetical protein
MVGDTMLASFSPTAMTTRWQAAVSKPAAVGLHRRTLQRKSYERMTEIPPDSETRCGRKVLRPSAWGQHAVGFIASCSRGIGKHRRHAFVDGLEKHGDHDNWQVVGQCETVSMTPPRHMGSSRGRRQRPQPPMMRSDRSNAPRADQRRRRRRVEKPLIDVRDSELHNSRVSSSVSSSVRQFTVPLP